MTYGFAVAYDVKMQTIFADVRRDRGGQGLSDAHDGTEREVDR